MLGILFFTVPDRGFFGRRLHWFGKVSYSLYLIHWPVGMAIVLSAKRIPFLAAHASVPVTAAVMASLGSAWLLHRFVERPSASLSRRLMKASSTQEFVPIPEALFNRARIIGTPEKAFGNVKRLMRRGRERQTV